MKKISTYLFLYTMCWLSTISWLLNAYLDNKCILSYRTKPFQSVPNPEVHTIKKYEHSVHDDKNIPFFRSHFSPSVIILMVCIAVVGICFHFEMKIWKTKRERERNKMCLYYVSVKIWFLAAWVVVVKTGITFACSILLARLSHA